MPATDEDTSSQAWSTSAQNGSVDGSGSNGRGDSPRISPEESASRIRDWLCSLEKSSGLSAAQQNRLDSTTASLGASSLVTRHDGMLDELDELLQSAESHKK